MWAARSRLAVRRIGCFLPSSHSGEIPLQARQIASSGARSVEAAFVLHGIARKRGS